MWDAYHIPSTIKDINEGIVCVNGGINYVQLLMKRTMNAQ